MKKPNLRVNINNFVVDDGARGKCSACKSFHFETVLISNQPYCRFCQEEKFPDSTAKFEKSDAKFHCPVSCGAEDLSFDEFFIGRCCVKASRWKSSETFFQNWYTQKIYFESREQEGEAEVKAETTKKAAEDATKAAEDAVKAAKDAGKAAQNAEKAAEDAKKAAKDAVKAAQNAEKAAENAGKAAENAEKAAEDAVKDLKDAIKTAVKAAENVEKATENAIKALEESLKSEKEAKDAHGELWYKKKWRKRVQKRALLTSKMAMKEDNSDIESENDENNSDEPKAGEPCTVCFEIYGEGDRQKAVVIPCGHQACFGCLSSPSLKTCPSCRADFTMDRVFKLFPSSQN